MDVRENQAPISGYDELYENIRYWVAQQQAMTNVPTSDVFDETEDDAIDGGDI